MLPQFYNTEVVKSEKLNENTFHLELKFKNSGFNFKAGQFVLVYRNLNGNEDKRAFSIASSPSKETIELLIRKYENGVLSLYLFNLKKGEFLKIRGPFGLFNVKSPLKDETIFIAGGTGIAPLRSMIYEILKESPDKKVSLIFGFRYEHDFFFQNEIENLKNIYNNFRFYACSTKPSDGWGGFKGRVTEIIPSIINSPDNKDVYICGPNPMINEVLNLLIKKLNFKKEQIFFERWSSA